MKKIYKSLSVIVAFALFTLHSSFFTSCTDVDSELVEFQEDNTLQSPNDSVYSLMGIIGKMQQIADRTIILGEIRGDLTAVTEQANSSLKSLADFTADATNAYNNARDYYAIIQNCNYYLAHIDTTLTKRGEKIFTREYAAVKSFRAWTYLQLAINYGSVPFFTEPILTEKDADPALYPKYSIEQICEYFIDDIKQYVDTKYPQYGAVGSFQSSKFYIPVRALLGDLCLWAGRYKEAAQYYHDYLCLKTNPQPLGSNSITWMDKDFLHTIDAYASQFSSTSGITIIPLASEDYEGLLTYLPDVFNSTTDNYYFYQATRSTAYNRLSQSQRYTLVYTDPTTQLPDTIYPADTLQYEDAAQKGDLRLSSIYNLRYTGTSDNTYNAYRQEVQKISDNCVTIYRLSHIYLRYCEALNRAGFPESAFCMIKYGLNYYNKPLYVSQREIEEAGNLTEFSEFYFTRENTVGLHSRGCGDTKCDSLFVIPACENLEDSIQAVENILCDEMALETAVEGQRYYDLIRLSMHRNDPTFLADKVARRNGDRDEALFQKLTNKQNWFLPLE